MGKLDFKHYVTYFLTFISLVLFIMISLDKFTKLDLHGGVASLGLIIIGVISIYLTSYFVFGIAEFRREHFIPIFFAIIGLVAMSMFLYKSGYLPSLMSTVIEGFR